MGWAEGKTGWEERSSTGCQTSPSYHLDCNETTQWIVDKIRVVEKTKELGDDLAGIIALQRRLKGMESDLIAIEAKVSTEPSNNGFIASNQMGGKYGMIHWCWQVKTTIP